MESLHKRMLARLPRNAGRWFEIQNAAGPIATVRIYEEIGVFGITAEDFAAELARITAREIEVQINSPGGSVFDGLAIFNTLRSHPARVTTRVDGIAASAASVIVQAGDHRVMLGAAQLMIHEAWGVAVGPAQDMRDMAVLLDQQNDVIAGIYASRAGGTKAKFLELMAAETWLTDSAAVELGLADEVVTPAPQKASNRSPARAQAAPVAVTTADLQRILDVFDDRTKTRGKDTAKSETDRFRQVVFDALDRMAKSR